MKNVAGLDMAKLMIGSFGTLAAIAVVNFKVFPAPVESRTWVMEFATAAEAFAERDRILSSVLQPTAIDLVNWPSGFRLLVRAGGNRGVLERYARELPQGKLQDESIWQEIREFTPNFLARVSAWRRGDHILEANGNACGDCQARACRASPALGPA